MNKTDDGELKIQLKFKNPSEISANKDIDIVEIETIKDVQFSLNKSGQIYIYRIPKFEKDEFKIPS
jgi:hypothetical protein